MEAKVVSSFAAILSVGQEIPFFDFPKITQTQLNAYAEASGDFNRIHLDEEVAKSVGLPGVIAHGMLIAGLVAERARGFVEDEMALSGLTVQSFQMRFKAMTFLGDSPSIGGVVKDVSADRLVLEIQARNAGIVSTLATLSYKFE